jgi:hypothetical protein
MSLVLSGLRDGAVRGYKLGGAAIDNSRSTGDRNPREKCGIVVSYINQMSCFESRSVRWIEILCTVNEKGSRN